MSEQSEREAYNEAAREDHEGREREAMDRPMFTQRDMDAAVQAEREACARTIGDLPIVDHAEARRVVIYGMSAIRNRTAPAVDVIGVVKNYLDALADFKKAALGDDFDTIMVMARRFDAAEAALRSLVPGAAANDKGEGR